MGLAQRYVLSEFYSSDWSATSAKRDAVGLVNLNASRYSSGVVLREMVLLSTMPF